MMKEVIRAMETGLLAEIGLIAFLLAFVLIMIKVVFMRPADRKKAKNIPLDDLEEVSGSSNHE